MDRNLRLHGAQRGEREVLQVQCGEPEKIGDRRDGTGPGWPICACGQRLDRRGPSAVTSCPDARRFATAPVTKAVPLMPARSKRRRRIASSRAAPTAVSITRPSTHQPTFVYDQNLAPGTPATASATSRESAPPSSSFRPAKPNSSPARSGSPERFARRSRSVARRAQPLARSSGTCPAARSSSDNRPAPARPAITVATIDLVNEPALKRVPAVTGSPVVTSAAPYYAVVASPSRRTPIAAPGTECLTAC